MYKVGVQKVVQSIKQIRPKLKKILKNTNTNFHRSKPFENVKHQKQKVDLVIVQNFQFLKITFAPFFINVKLAANILELDTTLNTTTLDTSF